MAPPSSSSPGAGADGGDLGPFEWLERSVQDAKDSHVGRAVAQLRFGDVGESFTACGVFGATLGFGREWKRNEGFVSEAAIASEEATIRAEYPGHKFESEKLQRQLRYYARRELTHLRVRASLPAALWAGAAFGALGGGHVLLGQVSELVRGSRDAWNDAVAGAVTGFGAGLAFMGVRGAAVGAIAGGALSVPLGWLR